MQASQVWRLAQGVAPCVGIRPIISAGSRPLGVLGKDQMSKELECQAQVYFQIATDRRAADDQDLENRLFFN